MEGGKVHQAQATNDANVIDEGARVDEIEEQLELQSAPDMVQNKEKGSNSETCSLPEQPADTAIADLESAPTLRKKPISVPRSKWRGLFASLTLLAEVDEPYLYSKGAKWFITFVVAFAAAATSLGSAIIYPALGETARDLDASATVTNLSVALYMLSISFFPLSWSSFSETAGRRTAYITSFIIFVLFAILSATAKSIGIFVAMRMLSGGAGASVQAVGVGTLADIWEPFERGKAMGRFYTGPLCGPLLAPIICGFVS
ncbi:Fc.00g106350.m01.CDS01 [Cosmosporella sp. VM-42]